LLTVAVETPQRWAMSFNDTMGPAPFYLIVFVISM
jgi:hypothetical protein